MHEVFKSESSKPIPKNCTKTSLILKTPKFYKNPKNLGFKEWNAWKWENRSLPSEEKTLKMLEKHLRKRFGVRVSDLEGEQVWTNWERSRKWELDRDKLIYRALVILDR